MRRVQPFFATTWSPETDKRRLYGSYTAGRFNKLYSTTVPNYDGYVSLQFVTQSGTTADVYIDGVMSVNLTAMGTLPPPLKEYFNNVPSTWADLATDSNITAIDGKVQSGDAWLNDLLPYVNGVGTLGYAWGV